MSAASRLKEVLVRTLHRVPALRVLGKKLLRRRVVVQPFHGGVICLDAVDHSWAWTGTARLEWWDHEVQDRLLALSADCRTMIDVGSNIGTMALAVALRNHAIEVVCVEPNARAAALLQRSIARNKLGDRMKVLEAVAGDADGEVAFDEAGSTTGHVSAHGAARRRSIDFARVVNEASAKGKCLVKVDVEGFETTLLAQLDRIARRSNVALLVEVHAYGFNGAGDPTACVDRLRASGASIVDVLSGEAVVAFERWTEPTRAVQLEARWV